MNPKELKVGDRIRIEAVVVTVEPPNYTGNMRTEVEFISGKKDWLHTNITDVATLITPSAPVEPWSPKHGEDIEWSNKTFDWQIGKYGCPHLDKGVHVVFNSEGNMGYARSIRPIVKPVTMEEELEEIVDSDDNTFEMHKRILAWHTKHTPPQRKMPSKEDFDKYYIENTNLTLSECMRSAFAHFGLEEKGGSQ